MGDVFSDDLDHHRIISRREQRAESKRRKAACNGKLKTVRRESKHVGIKRVADAHVMAPQTDPYFLDTVANRRNGQWFAEQLARFAHQGVVHLRGLHYKIASAGDVTKPDGETYVNSKDDWEWLSANASKAARWLEDLPFNRIRDQRNDAPQKFGGDEPNPWVSLEDGDEITIPSLDALLPIAHLSGTTGFDQATSRPIVWQPYRIVLIGEKSSLSDELLPLAMATGGELLLPTGCMSDTMLAELAARCAADPRPAVVFYFSDFDPSGRHMPLEVARKLQALRDLRHPDLDIALYPVALTYEQCVEFDLPSIPLKESERRGSAWKAEFGREQTELDALLSLHPGRLRQIAEKTIRPFYDPDLDEKISAAEDEWQDRADAVVNSSQCLRKRPRGVGGPA